MYSVQLIPLHGIYHSIILFWKTAPEHWHWTTLLRYQDWVCVHAFQYKKTTKSPTKIFSFPLLPLFEPSSLLMMYTLVLVLWNWNIMNIWKIGGWVKERYYDIRVDQVTKQHGWINLILFYHWPNWINKRKLHKSNQIMCYVKYLTYKYWIIRCWGRVSDIRLAPCERP